MPIQLLGDRRLSNFVKADVDNSFTGGTTTFNVVTGQGSRFPTLPYSLILYETTYADPADAYWQGAAEIVLVTARAGDVLTVVRGVDGTTPFASVGGKRYRFLLDATSGYLDNIPRRLNIRTYGAKIDGTTDDTAAIVAAVADLSSTGGGEIFIPRGSGPSIWNQAQVLIGKSHIAIIGEAGSRVKGAAGCTASEQLIRIHGSNASPISDILIRDIELDGNATNATISIGTQAHLIYLMHCDRVTIENCYLKDSPGDGICTTSDQLNPAPSAVRDLIIRDNRIETVYRNGISIVYAERVNIVGNKILNFNTVGIDIEANGAGDVNRQILIEGNWVQVAPIQYNSFNSNRLYAIQCKAPTAHDNQSMARIANNYIIGLFDSGAGLQFPQAGIFFIKFRCVTAIGNQIEFCRQGISSASDGTDDGSTGQITGNCISHCTPGTSGMGIQVRSHFTITGNLCEFNQGAGIRCNGEGNSVFSNVCRNNGLAGGAVQPYGIWVESSFNVIVGNQCYDDQPTVAVTLAATGSTVTVTHTAHGYATGDFPTFSNVSDALFENGGHTITVTGSNTYTYTVAGTPPASGTADVVKKQRYGVFVEDGAAGNLIAENDCRNNGQAGIRLPSNDNQVHQNHGFVTENSGTDAIASGTTSKVVNHGCQRTPRNREIYVTLLENPTNDPGIIWVSTITSTQFTVNCRSDPGASNLDFAWAVIPRPLV